MEILFFIVPVFIGIVFLTIFAMIGFQVIRGVAEWSHNNGMPIETVPARVVAKRTDMRGGGMQHGRHHVSTRYFVTFEMKTGERAEFALYGKDYGLLVEGDCGELTFQGTRYHGFQRRALA